MNLWQCRSPGCDATAVGCGGAAGLIAIGWFFVPGGDLFCPSHRPDPKACDENPSIPPCSRCTAEWVADHWQRQINDVYGYEHLGRRRFLALLDVANRHASETT